MTNARIFTQEEGLLRASSDAFPAIVYLSSLRMDLSDTLRFDDLREALHTEERPSFRVCAASFFFLDDLQCLWPILSMGPW